MRSRQHLGASRALTSGRHREKELRPGGSRDLQELEVEEEATVVTSESQLKDAVARMAKHIRIEDHLDLRSRSGRSRDRLPPPVTALDVVSSSVRSIRGDCATAPPATMLPDRGEEPLLPLRQRQCLILLDSGFLKTEHLLWLDGLYLRVTGEDHMALQVIDVLPPPPGQNIQMTKVWMVDVTIQGDANTNTPPHTGLISGISGTRASILAQRCTFSTLGGFGDASAVALESSQAFFQGCEFNQNYVGHDDAAAILARNSTAIILENTTFSGNYGKGQLLGTGPSGDGQEDASEFFADDADMQFCAGNALAMSVSAPADSTADFGVMEQWLERMQTDLGEITRPLPEGWVPLEPAENEMQECGHFSDYQDPPSAPLQATPAATAPVPSQIPAAASTRAVDPTPTAPAPAPPQPAQGDAPFPQPPSAGTAPRGRPPLPPPRPAAGSPLSTDIGADAPMLPRSDAPIMTMTQEPAPGQVSGMSEKGMTAVGIIAAALTVAVVALVALTLYYVRRPRRTSADKTRSVEVARALMLEESGDVTSMSSRFQPGVSPVSSAMSALPRPQSGQSLMHGSPAPSEGPPSQPGHAASQHGGPGSRAPHGQQGHSYAHPGGHGSNPESSQGIARSRSAMSISAQMLAGEAAGSWLGTESGRHMYAQAGAPSSGGTRAMAQPTAGSAAGSTARMRAMLHPPTDLGTLAESDAWDSVSQGYVLTPKDPGGTASAKQRLDFIEEQLDRLGAQGVILGRYEALNESRCRGGQAIVQFVRCLQTQQHYAIKFFASYAVFEDERDLYRNCCRGQFMPAVLEFVSNQDGSFRDSRGNPMPPCFVMEKGESLAQRMTRCKNDMFTLVQIIGQVARCLAELHSEGWVHRDLKPSNIMFLTRTASWTLIDFGLAARTGEAASIAFTLAYAPPEVAQLYDNRATNMIADPAADAWALGVMAFELMTGKPAFDLIGAGVKEVQQQLRGDLPLPWEGPRFTPAVRKSLGAFKTPILAMLTRNPAHRSTCQQLAAALHAVFLTPTTTVGPP